MRNGRGTVLVAYDGSPEAKRALTEAAAFGRRGQRVAVLHVIPAGSISSRLVTVSAEQEAEQRRLLAEAARILAAEGVSADAVGTVGDPLTEILAAVTEVDARLVAVGGHRHLLRHGLGDRLIRRARCGVLVVR
jgi:nucleotide-binding universal stress UspA family protein